MPAWAGIASWRHLQLAVPFPADHVANLHHRAGGEGNFLFRLPMAQQRASSTVWKNSAAIPSSRDGQRFCLQGASDDPRSL